MTDERTGDPTEERPDRPAALALLESLNFYRHAKVGLVAGVAIAVAAYLFRVAELLGPSAGTREFPLLGPEGWFLVLASVLAATSALLVTIALTTRTAVREARALD